jgi:hypothetical protein
VSVSTYLPSPPTTPATYRILMTLNRKRLTRSDRHHNTRYGQLRFRNLDTARWIQGLRVRRGDLGRWDRLHGRISCRARLQGIGHVEQFRVGGLGSSTCSRLVTRCVLGVGSACAFEVRDGFRYGSGEYVLSFHAGVGEAVRVDGELAAFFGDCDHLDEAGDGLASNPAGIWGVSTYYALSFVSSDRASSINDEAALPAVKRPAVVIGFTTY